MQPNTNTNNTDPMNIDVVMKMKREVITRSQLTYKEMRTVCGASDAMMRDFFPEPDYYMDNPIYDYWKPMRYYDSHRVAKVIATNEWQERMKLAAIRSERQKKVHRERHEKALSKKVYNDPYGRFTIKHGLSFEKMIHQAIKHSDLDVIDSITARKKLKYGDSAASAKLVFNYILDELVDIDMDSAPISVKIDVYKAIMRIFGDNRRIKMLCVEFLVDYISLN